MSDGKIDDKPFLIVVGGLGILFIALKLCGVIHWSWLWVTAPFWSGLALALACLFGLAIVTLAGGGK